MGYRFKDRDWCWLGILSTHIITPGPATSRRIILNGEVLSYWTKRRAMLHDLGQQLFMVALTTEIMEDPARSSSFGEYRYTNNRSPPPLILHRRHKDGDYADVIAHVLKLSQFSLHVRGKPDMQTSDTILVETFFIFIGCAFQDSGKDYSTPARILAAVLTAAKIRSFTDTSCLNTFNGEDPNSVFKDLAIQYECSVTQVIDPPSDGAKFHGTIEIFGIEVAECYGMDALDTRIKCDEIVPKIPTIQQYTRNVLAFHAAQLSKITRAEEQLRTGFNYRGLTRHLLNCSKEQLDQSMIRIQLPPVEKTLPHDQIPMKVSPILSLFVWKDEILSGGVHRFAEKADEVAQRRFCAAKLQGKPVKDFVLLDIAMFKKEVLDAMFNYYPLVPYYLDVFDSREKARKARK